MSRESAIKFLSGVVEEYGKVVLHPSHETEEYLVEEIKKVQDNNLTKIKLNLGISNDVAETLVAGRFCHITIIMYKGH